MTAQDDDPTAGSSQIAGSSLDARMSAAAQKISAALAQHCDAWTDEEALEAWLRAHAAANPHSRRSYVREARRLLAWLIWTKGPDDQLLPLMSAPEATAFVHWLEWPDSAVVPAEVLTRAGLPSTKPVKAGLSRSSLNQAVVILYGLYDFLSTLQAPWGPYAPRNPFRSLRKTVNKGTASAADRHPHDRASSSPTGTDTSVKSKVLSTKLWKEVLAEVELLPRRTPRDVRVYWQTWWVMRLQYHSAFRRFESVKALMRDIRRKENSYELQVTGKGGQRAAVPMSEVFVRDFTIYRLAVGLPSLPEQNESGPLIIHVDLAMRAKAAHVSEATLYRRVKDIFRSTADRLAQQGANAEDVASLRGSTLHGVRHTGIKHLLDAGVSLKATSRLARHASVTTTASYLAGDPRRPLTQINEGANKLDEVCGISDSANGTGGTEHGRADNAAAS